LPTIVLPAIVVGVVINYFGFTLDSLLAILFLGQIYIVWAQLEVALRQTRLSTLEYEPEFTLEIKEGTSGYPPPSSYSLKYYDIRLKNVGKHLARNIMVSAYITPATKHKPEITSYFVGNMAPDDSVTIFPIEEDAFRNSTITVELDYENILGEMGGMTFYKYGKILPSNFMVAKTVEMPGILLKSFEDLIRISNLLTFQRRIKRIREKQEKIKEHDFDPAIEPAS